jgi:hypothetical protein
VGWSSTVFGIEVASLDFLSVIDAFKLVGALLITVIAFVIIRNTSLPFVSVSHEIALEGIVHTHFV